MRTRQRLRRLALALGLIVLAGGCGGDDESAEQSTSTTATEAAAGGREPEASEGGEAPVVELVEPGSEPRKKLRLALAEGAALRAALTLKFGFELEADGKPLAANAVPPIRVDLGATVADVKDGGDARVDFAYERIEVVDDGTADKAVVEQVRKSGIDKLANLKGSSTITPRGVAKDSSVDLPEDIPDSLKQVVDQLSQQTGNLTVPFPEEAVGPGAEWKATTNSDVGGVKSKLVLTYGLRQLEGDRYVLDVSYEQTADRQRAEFPGLPEGTEVELRELLVKGTGEISGILTSVFPAASSLTAAGTVNLDVKSEKEQGKLLQRISLDVRFDTLPPA